MDKGTRVKRKKNGWTSIWMGGDINGWHMRMRTGGRCNTSRVAIVAPSMEAPRIVAVSKKAN